MTSAGRTPLPYDLTLPYLTLPYDLTLPYLNLTWPHDLTLPYLTLPYLAARPYRRYTDAPRLVPVACRCRRAR